MPTPPGRRWIRFRLQTLLNVAAVVAIAMLALPLAGVGYYYIANWKPEGQQAQSEDQIEMLLQANGIQAAIIDGPVEWQEMASPGQQNGRWHEITEKLAKKKRIVFVTGLPPGSKDLAPFASFTSSPGLWLYKIPASDVSPLAGLSNLEGLGLYEMPVTDITPLAGLTNLQVLILGGTQVSDVRLLAGLTKLKYLDLRGTQVTAEQIADLQVALPNCRIAHD